MEFKTHKLQILSTGEFRQLCNTHIHLKANDRFVDRVKVDWEDVTCKRCLRDKPTEGRK